MRILVYGAGPIGQWLALRLKLAGREVTLLARNKTLRLLEKDGIRIIDGLTGERLGARVGLIDRLDREDSFDLVVVAMPRAARLAVCPILARNRHLENILFLGNDFSGFPGYLDHLSESQVLLGFPRVGGGWTADGLTIMDREKPGGPAGTICLGELDGPLRERTRKIKGLLNQAGIGVSLEQDMDGWLKYHFAFMAPTAGAIFKKGGDLDAVSRDGESIQQYCRACREAGDVLAEAGYRKRQPGIFNLYYWLPHWLEPKVFGRLFSSSSAKVRFGLHVRTVGPELADLARDFRGLRDKTGLPTPTLEDLLRHVPGVVPGSAGQGGGA